MTITATWINSESEVLSLWMASDSRISDAHGRLMDEGVKLFELPVVCRGPGPSGFFDHPYFDITFGLVCSGSTLIFQQVYATLVPLLGSLAGFGQAPSLSDVAALVGRTTTTYTRSLGETRPHGAVASLVVAGVDPVDSRLRAFELSPTTDSEGLIDFVPRQVELADSRVLFTGDSVAVERAEERLSALRAEPVPSRPYHRAALNVIRELAVAEDLATVGGDVQIGFTAGRDFRRVTTVTPITHGESAAQRRLNNVDVDQLGTVGPCSLSMMGMVSP
jgi:hypothetical protein